MSFRHLGLGLVLVVPVILPSQAVPSVAVAHHLADSLARDFVARSESPSVVIGIMRGTDTIAMAGYGKANLEHDIDATAHSVYRIGSVTKQFTSAAVMQLVEQLKVRLSDPIAMFIPNLPQPWQPVTILQLLNHTSGIPSYTSLGPVWQKRWAEEMTPDTIIAMVRDKPMDFASGTNWRYNNTGYILLGMLIEKVTGHTWAEELQSRFAVPLGLRDTRECLNTPVIPRRAQGYEKEAGKWENTAYLAMSQPYAAGAMCSTVLDMARWNRALHTGKVVSPSSYAAMTIPEGAAAAGPARYGFGLMADTLAGRRVIIHGGGIHGFITGNAWEPTSALSVTVLTNSGSAGADRLLKQLVRASLGAPLLRPPVAAALSAADRAKYVGVYSLVLPNGPRDFTVAIGDEGVTGQLAMQNPNPMIYLGNDTFGVSFDPDARLIFTVEGGRATKLTLKQGGGTFEGVRK